MNCSPAKRGLNYKALQTTKRQDRDKVPVKIVMAGKLWGLDRVTVKFEKTVKLYVRSKINLFITTGIAKTCSTIRLRSK